MDVASAVEAEKEPENMATTSSGASSAFERLPEEIIQQILQLTEPNSFASAVLLNTKWRRVSQQAHLYAHQLWHCPSYAARHNTSLPAPVKDEDLPRLRRLFSQEIKRNLFEVYLRPKTTTIKLVSNSVSSSSAPGGEGMQFSSSPRGHHILAYNSSRIYVLDLRGSDLEVRRELKILRRPVSTCILDNGTVLAVLSSDMQVDIYDLREHPPRRTQSLILDHSPRTIALSPCGSVLAAAYEGGIEVSSLGSGAMPTDRRAVKCEAVDYLAFSSDGTQLLGTTTAAHQSNTVILTAPYYDPGAQMAEDNISALWTTSILFPNTSRDCSHATLLQESSSQEASWTFTYDRSFETFRAVRIDDLRNGTTYFTGPVPTSRTAAQSTFLPCTLPAATNCGDLVSAGFEGKDIWIYGVPEDLEAVPETHAESTVPGLSRHSSAPSTRSPSRSQEPVGGRVLQWQLLCDRNRNTFVSGRKIAQLHRVTTVKWVAGYGDFSFQERLVIAAQGVMPAKLITEEDGMDFVDGGRLTIVDFDLGFTNGKDTEITIEVGTKEPEVLEEELRDMATEVAIVRRRTVAQRGGVRSGLMRSGTSADRQADDLLRPPVPPIPTSNDDDDPLLPRRMVGPRTEARRASIHEDPEDPTLEDVQEALDAPYAHAAPRTAPTLRRAATAAAVNRRLHPSAANGGRVEYRRADGRAEHPHESDADDWVPPPPPYAKEDPGDVPSFLRHAAIPGVGLNQGNETSTALNTFFRIRTYASTIQQISRTAGVGEITDLTDFEKTLMATETRECFGGRQSKLHAHVITASAEYRSSRAFPEQSSQAAQASQLHKINTDAQRYAYGDTHASPSATYSASTGRSASSSEAQSAATTTSSGGLANGQPSNVITTPQGADVTEISNTAESPRVGRLSNAFTWPRALQLGQPTGAHNDGYPHSAPAIDTNNAEIIAANLPPAPTPDQLTRLNSRRDSRPPRPASGSFQVPRVPVGRVLHDRGRSSSGGSGHFSGVQSRAPEPDQPLIISTPKGVSGAFDTPDHGRSQQYDAGEPVIFAPVPRHPGPQAGTSNSRPTVERLETIYSIASVDGRNANHHNLTLPLHNEQGYGIPIPPAPPSAALTTTSLRHHTSLNRRQSRARRSAAKNIKDAKSRGWTGRRKKKKDSDDAMSLAWTDVTWASKAPRDGPGKDKKCAVM
ncbi:hypothetical protein E8E14_000374 [Neopestalotiopsis sp. 37M]|nr:hypothetical protein E8E14_000374 [Neopestalotiopsis sp. 37M]